MPDKPSRLYTIIKELINRSHNERKRLRILEQRADVLENRINSVEQFVNEQSKFIQKTAADTERIINTQDVKVKRMETALKETIKNVKKLATSPQIKELEQLIGIYNPIRSNFITKEEAQRLIEEKMLQK